MADVTKQEINPRGIRVFVYGSLKSGKHNNGIMAEAEFIGRCTVTGRYRMINLGAFPGVIEDPTLVEDRKVLGEVWRLPSKDTLEVLDIIEGHPDFYARQKVQTPWKGAWMYVLPPDYAQRAREVPFISGSYVWEPTEDEIEWAQANHG